MLCGASACPQCNTTQDEIWMLYVELFDVFTAVKETHLVYCSLFKLASHTDKTQARDGLMFRSFPEANLEQ